MATRNFQLQGSYTRYEDGYHAGYDSVEGPSKRRNFATIESAIRAAKKELKRNECTAVVRTEREYYGPNKLRDYNFNLYAADEVSIAERGAYDGGYERGLSDGREAERQGW